MYPLHSAAVRIDLYFLPAGPTAATPQQRLCCYGPMLGQTDGRTPFRFMDPGPHTTRAVPIIPHSTFRKIFNTRSQETVDACLEMFGCLQAERTIAIRKRKFLNKFSVTHNALRRVFVAIAKTEHESCCTDD